MMDCNNYSYVNTTPTTTPIASYDNGLVSMELLCDWFNELSYMVTDVLNDVCQDFGFYRYDGESERKAYEKAASLYNSLVPDGEAIPLF